MGPEPAESIRVLSKTARIPDSVLRLHAQGLLERSGDNSAISGMVFQQNEIRQTIIFVFVYDFLIHISLRL